MGKTLENLVSEKMNILFISPDFYQYTKQILAALKKKNIEVYFFPVRPKMSKFKKWLMQESPFFNNLVMSHYSKKILKLAPKKIDLIVFNDPVFFSKRQIEKILSFYPQAQSAINLWDTISYYPKTSLLLGLFKNKTSFDISDCAKYGLEYQPDFYDSECEHFVDRTSVYSSEFDVVFIGAAYPNRYNLLKKLAIYLDENKITYKFLLYFSSKATYYYHKIRNKQFKNSSQGEFIFKPISPSEKNQLISSSKAVIDIHYREDQDGLSTREIETLLLGKKLITTSQAIKRFDLYEPENVAIITTEKFDSITKDFLNSKNRPYPKNFWKEYSVDSFVDNIFCRRFK
jgi:hypothetical protein